MPYAISGMPAMGPGVHRRPTIVMHMERPASVAHVHVVMVLSWSKAGACRGYSTVMPAWQMASAEAIMAYAKKVRF